MEAAREREAARRQQDAQDAEAALERRQFLSRQKTSDLASHAQRAKAQLSAQEEAMAGEQHRLAAEKERRSSIEAAALAKRASSTRSVEDDFAYTFEAGVEAAVKAFRQRGGRGDALIIKIDHDKGQLQLEEQCQSLPSVEFLADRLDDAKPRYLLYIHEVAHADGRKQYPICLLLFLPEAVPTHLKVLYTRPVGGLAESIKVARHFTLTDAEDLTAEWLEERLKG